MKDTGCAFSPNQPINGDLGFSPSGPDRGEGVAMGGVDVTNCNINNTLP